MNVTSNIIQRTFHIRYGDRCGASFTVDVNNCRYLVTAQHLVENIIKQDTLYIERDGVWTPFQVSLVGHCEGEVDLSVLAPHLLFGPVHPLVVTETDLKISEEVYFLGFPYGLSFDGPQNDGFPLPLVKGAIVSAIYHKEGRLLLDGQNNPGFSGGPVVRRWDGSNQVVVGVISAFRKDYSHVIDDKGNFGPYRSVTNSGIVNVYCAQKVNDLISSNPIGIRVS